MVEAKNTPFGFIPNNENWADCLTKALPKPALLKCLDGMVIGHTNVNGETESVF